MLTDTIWRDMRWRLLVAVPVVLLIALLIANAYSSYARDHAVDGAAPSYLAYLDAAWFELPGASAIFLPVAVLLASGGIVTRRRSELVFLLALPLERRSWLLAYMRWSLIALALLVLLTVVIFAIAAWAVGARLPLGPLLLRSAGVVLAGAVWIGITMALLARIRGALLTARGGSSRGGWGARGAPSTSATGALVPPEVRESGYVSGCDSNSPIRLRAARATSAARSADRVGGRLRLAS